MRPWTDGEALLGLGHLALDLVRRARHQGTVHEVHERDAGEGEDDRDGEHEEQRQARANGELTTSRASASRNGVANAANRADDRRLRFEIDLAAQVANVDLDDVGIAVEVSCPRPRCRISLLASGSSALVMRNSSSANSRGVERDVAAVRASTVRRSGIERDRSHDEPLRAIAVVATQQRVDARQQDRALEGLAQEVVGADLETLDLVQLAVLRGEHQQRRVDPGRCAGRGRR